MRTGELQAARTHLERSAVISEQLLGPNHLENAWINYFLGSVHYSLDDTGQASQFWEKVVTVRGQVLGPAHQSLGNIYYKLACISATNGQRDQAFDLLRKMLDCGWTKSGIMDNPALDILRGDPELELILAESSRLQLGAESDSPNRRAEAEVPTYREVVQAVQIAEPPGSSSGLHSKVRSAEE
jgi:hypothetical protein